MIIDVIEPLRPGKTSPFLDIDDTLAEPTPEARVTVPAYAALLPFFLDRLQIGDFMVLLQVVFERFTAMANSATDPGRAVLELFVTLPYLQLEMLAILVPLPVILAAKPFRAFRKCATIRFLVTLSVFSTSPS